MNRLNNSQSGMISLIISMMLMIVVSLMTLSFATLSRREQRQALDKQLSTQAFYAAETGINDASKAILDGLLNSNILDCSDSEQAKINPTGATNVLDATSNVVRTCVFVDQTPSQIDDVVGESATTVFPISASGLASLDIYWENDSAVSLPVFPAIDTVNGSFPPDASWNNSSPGVLTVQLIPFPTTGTNRTTIANGMIYVYGYPTSSNANQTATAGAVGTNGRIMGGGCVSTNLPRQCKITINGLNEEYYIVLKSTYDPVHVTIEGKNGSGVRLPFVGAQVLIDSTGRANDVTERIKVYKSLRASASLPSSVLEIGNDLCKRLQSNPTSTTTDSSIASCDPTSL